MKKILFVSLAALILFSCKKEKSAEPATPVVNTSNCDTTITYTSQIKTIIDNNCVSCHSGSTPSGGVNFTTYANVKVKADAGRIKARAIDASPSIMPPTGSLSAADITTISCWLQNGAKE